jgi:Ala-tRNA(Pro) deacylase
MKIVEDFLKENKIDYVVHEHPAVLTCEEAKEHCSHVPGVASKNLFLRDEKKQRYFLVILDASKRADLKKLGEIFAAKRLSFANEVELKEKLGLEPGSVSLFGILNDKKKEVELYIDSDFYDESVVNFHPNRNTASVELSREMLKKVLDCLEHKSNIVEIL